MQRRLFLQISAIAALSINRVFSESFLVDSLIDFTPISQLQGFQIASGFNLVKGIGFGDRISNENIDFFGDFSSGLVLQNINEKFFLFATHAFFDTTAKKFKEMLDVQSDEDMWSGNKDIFTVMTRSVGLSFLEMQGVDLLNVVLDSKENIRIHANSPVFVSGRLTEFLNYKNQFIEAEIPDIKDIQNKKIVRGLLSTKGGVATPWGSVLCVESNFYKFFQDYEGDLQWHKFDKFYKTESNNINNFGYVVEYINGKVFKRTTLGRSSFESIDISVDEMGTIVIYLCSTNGYFYKFICDSKYNSDNKTNTEFLNNGNLFVARFNNLNNIDINNKTIKNSVGEWILLSLENSQIKERFKTYEEVLFDIDVASSIANTDGGFTSVSVGSPYIYVINKNSILRINHKENKHYQNSFIWESVMDEYPNICSVTDYMNKENCLIPTSIKLDSKSRLWIAVGIDLQNLKEDSLPLVGSLLCMDTNSLEVKKFMQLSENEYIYSINSFGADLVVSILDISKYETDVYKIVRI